MSLTAIEEITYAKIRGDKEAFLQCIAGQCTLWDKNPLIGAGPKILGYWMLTEHEAGLMAEAGVVDSFV